jgi:acetate kinase
VVGHRVVHGGTRFTGPALITDTVREQLAALTDLAPLHQPKSLATGKSSLARVGVRAHRETSIESPRGS